MENNRGMDEYLNKVIVNESNFAHMVDEIDWCVSQEDCLNSALFKNKLSLIPHCHQCIVPS